ncbi:MAG TPA: hypothetical protein VF202_10785 [Trueperaceae bacterium]
MSDRTRRLHALTSRDEHLALLILAQRHPAVFDEIADTVEEIRRKEARVRRTPQRPTLHLPRKDHQ